MHARAAAADKLSSCVDSRKTYLEEISLAEAFADNDHSSPSTVRKRSCAPEVR